MLLLCYPDRVLNSNLSAKKPSLVFFGSSEFSAQVLEFLIHEGFLCTLVVTQPDKPVGRKGKLQAPRVKQLALENEIPCYQPSSLKKLDPWYRLRSLSFDFGVVVAYGKLLPQRILDTANYCFLNGHASDLPRFRGAAPMERALIAGDSKTAMCIMQMTSGLDEGDVLSRETLEICTELDINGLEQKMIQSCNRQLKQVALGYPVFSAKRRSQPSEGVSYASKISEVDARIDLENDLGSEIFNRLRAMKRKYGIHFELNGTKLAVFDAAFIPEEGSAPPGTVVKRTTKELIIAVNGGCLRIIELQLSGRKRLPVHSFLSGSTLRDGDILKSGS
jgi:methionyl-tRNA formyltransferase